MGQTVPALFNVQVSKPLVRVGFGVVQPARLSCFVQALRHSKALAKHR